MTQTRPILLLTRPRAASEAFIAALRKAGENRFEPVISPLIGVETCGVLPDMTRYIGLIFTSANGVAAYVALGGPIDRQCYVVGAATAAAARGAGFDPLSADGDAAALVELILGLPADGPLLHLRGTHATGNIAETLSLSGIETRKAVIYDQPLLDLTDSACDALNGTAPVIVPLFSPRSAARFSELRVGQAPLLIAAMSPSIMQEVLDLNPIATIVTAQPSGEAMQNAVSQLLGSARMLEGGQDAQ
ncbi:uroporphyrinogen-III synthase [Puniceibacterium sediminis]|uniref:Uroporphyrinogen-III synthase n=1 Tax=Puniceibacterium sediminis TaxID=1608407 RepID=A0A238WVC9_9RHOB|nr:uroporphyrinogen-III synthase [Puniceibacterium sediminis]SNR50492.1 uroporphyrinogen-III synthase [Puniceibacterium sediminis]